MPPVDAIEISELEEFEPSRVDGVGKGANGFPILMLKSVGGEVTETEITSDAVVAELDKADADDDRPACKTCDGSGKIMAGNRKCPDCFGSGKAPKVGESAKAYVQALKEAGVAPSGAPVDPPHDCPTCNGSGTIAGESANGKTCPDCDGSGRDGTTMPGNTKDADTGKITEGAGGRETVDKSCGCDGCLANSDDPELAAKAEMSSKDINDLPDSAFAYIEPGGKKDDQGKTTPRALRHFPVHDAAHARNALSRAPQSPFGDKAMPTIKAAAKKFGIEVSAKGVIVKDNSVEGPNPFLGAEVSTDTPSDATDPTIPGSPAWEAVDAQTATDAATALMTAAELIRQFAQREAQEVVAGEGNDVFDTSAAYSALCGVTDALGIMAQMAFHEGIEAAKSLSDEDVVEKAGRRLSSKTVTAMATARDKAKDLANHLTGVLGDDDPAKKAQDNDAASKSAVSELLTKEIEDMTAEELIKLLDERDEARRAAESAEKGKAAMDEQDSQDAAHDANNKSKKKAPKDENTDLEDEADQGDSDSANTSPQGAAKAESDEGEKAELTPEEIEARDARKAAKKALKEAERVEKEATENAALTKAIEEHLAKVVEQNAVLNTTVEKLSGELEAMKQRVVPSTIVRTSPKDAVSKSVERDAIDSEISKYEALAKSTQEPELRRGYTDRAKELRIKREAL